MKKLLIAPIYSLSGYGSRSREFLNLIPPNIEFDIIVTNWGNTINEKFTLPANLNVIHEFNKFNFDFDINQDIYDTCFIIGIGTEPFSMFTLDRGNTYLLTAGVETTIHPEIDSWYDGDSFRNVKILGSSNHSINNIHHSRLEVFPETYQQPNKVDTGIFDFIDKPSILISGAWIPGKFGEDRKNIPMSIEYAIAGIVASKKEVDIVLHTAIGSYSNIEFYNLKRIISNIRNRFNYDTSHIKIHFIHGLLSPEELRELYEHPNISWMFSMTHGEGFGRMFYEFMSYGGRIIAPKYSGYLDYLDEKENILYDVELRQIDKSVVNQYLLENSKWAYPIGDGKYIIDIIKNLNFNIERSNVNFQRYIDNENNAIRILDEII